MLESKKKPTLFIRKNTKEVKEDISIVKLNVANVHYKVVIPQLTSTETLKNRCITLIDAKN